MVARRIEYAPCCPAVARCLSAVREALRRRGGSLAADGRAARMVVDVRGRRASARERGDSVIGLASGLGELRARGGARRDRERARRGGGCADQQTRDVPRDVGLAGLRDAVRHRRKADRRRSRGSEPPLRALRSRADRDAAISRGSVRRVDGGGLEVRNDVDRVRQHGRRGLVLGARAAGRGSTDAVGGDALIRWYAFRALTDDGLETLVADSLASLPDGGSARLLNFALERGALRFDNDQWTIDLPKFRDAVRETAAITAIPDLACYSEMTPPLQRTVALIAALPKTTTER